MPERPQRSLYEIINDSILESEVKQQMPIARKIAQYIHKHNTDFVIVPGAGAQIAALMVKEAWKRDPKLRKTTLPKFFALATIRRIGGNGLVNFSEEEISKLLSNRLGNQIKAPAEKKVFILEDCVHSGETLIKLKKTLRNMGFTNVRTGTMTYLYDDNTVARLVDIAGIEKHCPRYRGEKHFAVNEYLAIKNFLGRGRRTFEFSNTPITKEEEKALRNRISIKRKESLERMRRLRATIRRHA